MPIARAAIVRIWLSELAWRLWLAQGARDDRLLVDPLGIVRPMLEFT